MLFYQPTPVRISAHDNRQRARADILVDLGSGSAMSAASMLTGVQGRIEVQPAMLRLRGERPVTLSIDSRSASNVGGKMLDTKVKKTLSS